MCCVARANSVPSIAYRGVSFPSRATKCCAARANSVSLLKNSARLQYEADDVLRNQGQQRTVRIARRGELSSRATKCCVARANSVL